MTIWLDIAPIAASSIISLVLLIALLVFGWALRHYLKVNLGGFFSVFALLAAVGVWISLNYKYGALQQWRLDTFLRWYDAIILFIAVMFGAKIFSFFFWDMYITGRRKAYVPGVLRSIVTIFILVTALLLIVRFIFAKELSGLLIASSVTAAIIGFALQDFLSGVIGGIAINLEAPFQVGDWVIIADKEGQVVDINWRATTLRTRDWTYIVIPNSVVSKEQLINFYKPTKVHAMKVYVGIEYGAAPTKVKEILLDSARGAKGVIFPPGPISRVISFDNFSVNYELKYWIEDRAICEDIRSDVMTNIWYNLRRKGVKIPFPIQDIFLHQDLTQGQEAARELNRKRVESLLRHVSVFEPLADDDIAILAAVGDDCFFGRGQQIVKQGEYGSSFYLILDGEASVSIKSADGGKDITVARLKPGDFFGEKSLLTGEPRSATVSAETDLEVVEIEKRNLLPILESSPGIMEDLSRRLAERQLMNEGFFKEEKDASEVVRARNNYSAKFLKSMKSFFGI